jgi:hypothetical protein
MTPQAASNQATTQGRRHRPAGSATSSRVAYFEYFGGRSRIVRGSVSGQQYYFLGQHALVAVDARDRLTLSTVSGLRELEI